MEDEASQRILDRKGKRFSAQATSDFHRCACLLIGDHHATPLHQPHSAADQHQPRKELQSSFRGCGNNSALRANTTPLGIPSFAANTIGCRISETY
jgi:hypothetical protein